MTNMTLQDAMTALREGSVRVWEGIHTNPEAERVILNAVASGDLIPRADADAAVARGMERAAEAVEDNFPGALYLSNMNKAVEAIRALAPASGIAQLEALREERDALETAREMLGGFWAKAIAERDTLAAKLAEAEAREKALLEALIWCSGSDDFQHGGKARAGWLKLCAPLIASRTEEGGE